MEQKTKDISTRHLADIKLICTKYDYDKGEIINILNDIQNIVGYLPKNIQQAIAQELSITQAKIGGLVGFYSFFRTYPLGKHVVTVCQGGACSKKNAAEILDAFKKNLEIELGQTTNDGKITLNSSGCIGACSLAPVTMVDDNTYPSNNTANVEQIVAELTKEKSRKNNTSAE